MARSPITGSDKFSDFARLPLTLLQNTPSPALAPDRPFFVQAPSVYTYYMNVGNHRQLEKSVENSPNR